MKKYQKERLLKIQHLRTKIALERIELINSSKELYQTTSALRFLKWIGPKILPRAPFFAKSNYFIKPCAWLKRHPYLKSLAAAIAPSFIPYCSQLFAYRNFKHYLRWGAISLVTWQIYQIIRKKIKN